MIDLTNAAALDLSAPVAAAASANDDSASGKPILDGLHVLVVDDNDTNRRVVAAMLEASGVLVAMAEDGEKALGRLRDGGFDVVLTDIRMPGMSGVQLLERIRQGGSGRSDIPVIALTGDPGLFETSESANGGFDAVQTKPIRAASLLAAITRLALARGPGPV